VSFFDLFPHSFSLHNALITDITHLFLFYLFSLATITLTLPPDAVLLS